MLKTLLSAAANAKQNLGLRKAKLVVSECFADEGPVLKRAQPRAQVRARLPTVLQLQGLPRARAYSREHRICKRAMSIVVSCASALHALALACACTVD